MLCRAAGFALGLLIVASVPHFGGAAAETVDVTPAGAARQFLMLSDLHFDPMADRELVDRLAATEPDQWRAVLESSQDLNIGQYRRDTNWMLLRSALQQMADTLPNAAFLLMPGDFLAHNFRQKFDAAASDHSNAAYRVFVRRTMQFLGQQLRQAFPVAAILPALGNNDDECGNYQLEPGGPFLADMLPIWRTLIGGDPGSRFDQNWSSYGNYSAAIGGIRVIFPNTVFFSVRYRNACGSASDSDPGRATLGWLEAELAAARQAQEHVWLAYHIPPGIDGYATFRDGACPDRIIPMWVEAYAEPFDALLRRYSDIVVASFAGHTHMDDFRLAGASNARYAFTLITPALSPIYGQNPAFRTVVYNQAGNILDQTTYDLANLLEVAAAGEARPAWQAEYTFTRLWRLPRVDLESLDRLHSQIDEIPAQREQWHTIFTVSSPVYWPPIFKSGRAAQAVRAFRCAAGNDRLPDFRQCYCDAN